MCSLEVRQQTVNLFNTSSSLVTFASLNKFKGEINIMPVMKKNLQFKKAELIFEDDKVIVIEELKDDVVETDLIEKLRMFEGQKGLSISISLENNA